MAIMDREVSIPYKAGQHFKSLVLFFVVSQVVSVSIPYKAGQHFKSGLGRPRSGAMWTWISIPYKAGQHFKTIRKVFLRGKGQDMFQSPTNRVNTSKASAAADEER